MNDLLGQILIWAGLGLLAAAGVWVIGGLGGVRVAVDNILRALR